MAKKRERSTNGETKTAAYRHTRERRTNIPPAKIAAEGKVPRVPKVRYHYSPHLPPALRSDPAGKADQLPELIAEAGRRPLTEAEQHTLADALRHHQPWLEWAGKSEQHELGHFQVDPVALHLHERVSAQAIVRALQRQEVQRDLFADPQQSYDRAVQFYRHDVQWANRLILGDSLEVMTSLSRREALAGRVQMIYFDPPYGIKFGTNFQPEVRQPEVGDKDKDLSREVETVRAYRDIWELGTHSYLTYLRNRLIAARDLLADAGSIFVQISDDNVHRVRLLLDEVFGVAQFVTQIQFKKTGAASSSSVATVCDYLLWYAKRGATVAIYDVFKTQGAEDVDLAFYDRVLAPSGELRKLTDAERRDPGQIPADCVLVARNPIVSPGTSKTGSSPIDFEGQRYPCPEGRHWSQGPAGMARLARAGRLCRKGRTLRFVKPVTDSGVVNLTNTWMDLGSGGFVGEKRKYIVKTDLRVIERCLLLTTEPGDLVLDPTCGGGSTALVAEEWGRRWITIDTSRVAIAITRNRLMTECVFPHYKLRDEELGPRSGFVLPEVAKIEPSDIGKNEALDPILDRYERLQDDALEACNAALERVTPDVRQALVRKHDAHARDVGLGNVSDAQTRRWLLPESRFEHWTVPFDVDPAWPQALADAVAAYRTLHKRKAAELNRSIRAGLQPKALRHAPEVIRGVTRVSGPYTVEGVRPEELSLGEDGLFDATPNEFESEDSGVGGDAQNVQAHLSSMLQHLRRDGVTFMNNAVSRFAQLEALFDSSSASLLHAEGTWNGEGGERRVAVTFGPENGPVTALQVEEAIREARQYDDLVIAGFSFDAEATAVVAEQSHPKLRIHQVFIRPDLNSAMEGLLKDTPRSQLFTVFGQPELDDPIETSEGWVVTLKGVDIYNPVENTVRSTGADKVAAWFLDSDFDGRCFCIAQAFFPDQNAWDKIAKALGSSADPEAFEKLKGTTSLPFPKGKYGRIAVKVIDPRGNEVMAIRKLP